GRAGGAGAAQPARHFPAHLRRRAGARLFSQQGGGMSVPTYLGIAEGAALLRAKKLSPVEWTQALIARVEAHDPKLNAFLRFTPELALEDARRAEAEIAAGQWRG